LRKGGEGAKKKSLPVTVLAGKRKNLLETREAKSRCSTAELGIMTRSTEECFLKLLRGKWKRKFTGES